jgi:hypothetical protein
MVNDGLTKQSAFFRYRPVGYPSPRRFSRKPPDNEANECVFGETGSGKPVRFF